MKLIDVKNEMAVTCVLTYVRVLERYLSLTDSTIQHDMCPMNAHNMIQLKRWSRKGTKSGSYSFRLFFHLDTKSGKTLWIAHCELDSDYYSITIKDIGFVKVKAYVPGSRDWFGVDCEFGFLSFEEIVSPSRAIDLLKGYVDEKDILFQDMCTARVMAESHGAKIEELTQELEDLKQQLADIYWSTQN